MRLITLSYICAAALLSLSGYCGEDVKIETEKSLTDDIEGYSATTPVYSVKISKEGQIVSVKLGDLELFEHGIRIGVAGANSPADDISPSGAKAYHVRYHEMPVADYKFERDSFQIVIQNKRKIWDFGLFYSLSNRAQTITSKERGFENVALPMLKARVAYNDTNYTYDDGSTMSVTQAGPGNHINSDENGYFGELEWGRKFLEVGQTYTYTFRFKKGDPGTQYLAAPPFAIRSGRIGNIYNSGEPISLSLAFKPEHYQKFLGKVDDVVVAVSIRDMWNETVSEQTIPIDFAKARIEEPAGAKDPKHRNAVALFPISLEIKRKGWFEVDFTVKDKQGKVIPNHDSTTIAIVTPVEGLPHAPFEERPEVYDLDGFLGLTCTRQSINWDTTFSYSTGVPEPSLSKSMEDLDAKPADTDLGAVLDVGAKNAPAKPKPSWIPNWQGLDAQMAAAESAHARYGQTVFWLIEPGKKGWKSPELLEEGVYQIVNRYKSRNKYWMVFNEPNLTMSPADYVKNVLSPAYRAMKKADPDAMLMGPDTCGVNPGWLEEVYKSGGKMDIVDMHPYTGHSRGWEENGIADAWRKVREIMTAHGDGAKEIWSTESGYDWSLGRLGVNAHARHIVRQYPLAQSVGIPKNHFFLYFTRAMGFIKFYLVDYDDRLLPGGVAARVQSEQLVGTEFAGEKEIGKDRHAFLYRGKTEDVWMAWSNDVKTSMAANVASKKLIVVDMMGNVVSDQSMPDGAKRKVIVSLSGYPVYIRVDKDAAVEPLIEVLGENLARQAGVQVSASSEEPAGCAAKVVDGVWTSENTGSYEGKLWTSAKSFKDATVKDAWLEFKLPQKHAVNRVDVHAPSSICGMPGLRDFAVLAFDDAKNDWAPVASVAGSEEAWTFHLEFPSVTTDRIKLDITALNNGFKLNDRSDYTDMKARVSEIEIYNASK